MFPSFCSVFMRQSFPQKPCNRTVLSQAFASCFNSQKATFCSLGQICQVSVKRELLSTAIRCLSEQLQIQTRCFVSKIYSFTISTVRVSISEFWHNSSASFSGKPFHSDLIPIQVVALERDNVYIWSPFLYLQHIVLKLTLLALA